jgi:hypothetical protein
MCDYSLEHQNSREAKLEDVIITSQFRNSSTMGFAAVNEPDVAVCLMPGTELVFDRPIEVDGFLTWTKLLSKGSNSRVAVFRKVNPHLISTHHDALELPNGQVILINSLRRGQRARVVQLPVGAHSRWSENSKASEHEIVHNAHELID